MILSRVIQKLGLICLTVTVISCNSINVNDIDVDIDIKRLDKDLFTINPDSLISSIPFLSEKYGHFLNLYCYAVVQTGNPNDPQGAQNLVNFVTDFNTFKLVDVVNKTYPDFSSYESEIEHAFKYYKYYFPDANIPNVYTCYSDFNYSIVLDSAIIGIGLDRYLGDTCTLYNQFGIDKYIQRRMTPERILPDVISGLSNLEFPYNDSINSVISHMIYKGREFYFQKALLPEVADTRIFGFTEEKLDWCINSESLMWEYLIEHKLLFKNDLMQINKLTNVAPFTAGFGDKSPGMAAVWVGYKIVDQYMNKNNEITLEQLMNETNYRIILDRSRYNP